MIRVGDLGFWSWGDSVLPACHSHLEKKEGKKSKEKVAPRSLIFKVFDITFVIIDLSSICILILCLLIGFCLFVRFPQNFCMFLIMQKVNDFFCGRLWAKPATFVINWS